MIIRGTNQQMLLVQAGKSIIFGAYVLRYLGKDLDSRGGGVELSGAVVGDPDAVHALPHSLRRVFRGHDALYDDLIKGTYRQ